MGENRAYDRSRKSLRIWPILGTNDEDMWGNFGDFLLDTLGLGDDEVHINKVISIVRTEAKGNFTYDEVLVGFSNAATGYTVIGRSNRLASCVDGNGNPTARIIMDVPHPLLDISRTLISFGNSMLLKHGNGTKRHVKFDDMDRTLYLNIKLPGDNRWTWVSPDMARGSMKQEELRDFNSLQRRPGSVSHTSSGSVPSHRE